MLTHNTDPKHGWVNGTRCRLRAKNAWTGNPKYLSKGVQGCSAEQVYLENEAKYPEYDVYVIRDEEGTLTKRVRYEDADVHVIPVRTDKTHVSGVQSQWKQVQAIPAYALTYHKAQGIAAPLVYIGLEDVFGFGMSYTVLTRTKFADNMLLVGVPPQDILQALIAKDSTGVDMITRKKKRGPHFAA